MATLSQLVFLLCGNYLPLEKSMALLSNKLESHTAKKVVGTTLLHLPIITQDT